MRHILSILFLACLSTYANAATLPDVTQVTGSTVTLAWTPPTVSPDPVAGYLLYKKIVGGNYALIFTTPTTTTTYNDSVVSSGTTYDYYAVSVDASGVQSVPSNTAVVLIPSGTFIPTPPTVGVIEVS